MCGEVMWSHSTPCCCQMGRIECVRPVRPVRDKVCRAWPADVGNGRACRLLQLLLLIKMTTHLQLTEMPLTAVFSTKTAPPWSAVLLRNVTPVMLTRRPLPGYISCTLPA